MKKGADIDIFSYPNGEKEEEGSTENGAKGIFDFLRNAFNSKVRELKYIPETAKNDIKQLFDEGILTKRQKNKIFSGEYAIYDFLPNSYCEPIDWAIANNVFKEEILFDPNEKELDDHKKRRWILIKPVSPKFPENLVYSSVPVSDYL